MPYEVMWDNPDKTILRLEFHGQWTWDEWYLGHDAANLEITAVAHHVNLIECYYYMMPPGNAIMPIKYAGSRQPPNTRHTVFVNGAGMVFRNVLDSVVKLMGWHGPHFCRTVEEARAYLQTLPP